MSRDETPTPRPDAALVRKGAQAIASLMPPSSSDGDAVDASTLARAVLAAVVDDIHRTPVVNRETLIDTALEQARADRDRLAAALRTIAGPASHGDPWIEVYREAGGGYEGLQAIARAALDDNGGSDD